MGEQPFDVELIALGYMRPVGMNSKKKSWADHGGLPHKCCPRTATANIFFPITNHPTRSEMLGKVTDFGYPNLNIEPVALDKSPGGWVVF